MNLKGEHQAQNPSVIQLERRLSGIKLGFGAWGKHYTFLQALQLSFVFTSIKYGHCFGYNLHNNFFYINYLHLNYAPLLHLFSTSLHIY